MTLAIIQLACILFTFMVYKRSLVNLFVALTRPDLCGIILYNKVQVMRAMMKVKMKKKTMKTKKKEKGVLATEARIRSHVAVSGFATTLGGRHPRPLASYWLS